jgi:L-2-hydroxyglutarate oxidase
LSHPGKHTSAVTTCTDFLVIGGGVVGLSIARSLKRRFRDQRVVLLEKESVVGTHASGRNSGVLHAGFYYTPDSLKARFTRQGNQLLAGYCRDKNLKLNRCGKLVVARDANDQPAMNELLKRGRANGIELHDISAREAKRIEPRVNTYERALWSPTTAVVHPAEVVTALAKDAQVEGVDVRCGTRFLRKCQRLLHTSTGIYEAGYVVNAAGLYADVVARAFGMGESYGMLPFKGLYLYADNPDWSLRTNVYPVPDLRNPFLGVHFTVTAEGRTKIGPTAIPALWREQYQGTKNFRLGECGDIVRRQLGLLLSSDWGFHRLAAEEMWKYSRMRLVSLASRLVDGVSEGRFRTWGRAGIRAQLLNVKTRRLEMDFVIEGDDRSMHVLNAVSPGFTCALPFADYVTARIAEQLEGGGATAQRRGTAAHPGPAGPDSPRDPVAPVARSAAVACMNAASPSAHAL